MAALVPISFSVDAQITADQVVKFLESPEWRRLTAQARAAVADFVHRTEAEAKNAGVVVLGQAPEMPAPLKPAKAEAPSGYRLCSECKGTKVRGPQGLACVCVRYSQHPGFERYAEPVEPGGEEEATCAKCGHSWFDHGNGSRSCDFRAHGNALECGCAEWMTAEDLAAEAKAAP